jgi:hypothetical protein
LIQTRDVPEHCVICFFAVAKFRQANFGQLLYGGDAVIEEGWDVRDWHSRKDIRRNLFWLAAEAVLEL